MKLEWKATYISLGGQPWFSPVSYQKNQINHACLKLYKVKGLPGQYSCS